MIEDYILINRLKKGDSQALCRIYKKYGESLLAMAICMAHDRTIAEDALQDVFYNFVKNIDTFVLTGRLKTYLAQCLANRIVDLKRNQKTYSSAIETIKAMQSNSDASEESIEKMEQLNRLEQALQRLPEEQRQVIFMRIHGQLKCQQIADTLGLSVDTIRGRYRYGLKKLKSLLIG